METQPTSVTVQEKSEILFLYESTYSIPNGDPFTGEQRYDEETKKILVSDVRIKRFIRDELYRLSKSEDENYKDIEIYVQNQDLDFSAKESGAAARVKALKEKFKDDASLKKLDKKGSPTKDFDTQKLLTKCIDVRLFGGISTEEGDAVNLTGPIQFSLLNPSLNAVDLRTHQNTSVFPSKGGNKQGAIGTTSVVPYALLQIHGWINAYSAEKTGLTQGDLDKMFATLWQSVNNINTRSKNNQNSLLLLQVVYKDTKSKIYGLEQQIKLAPKEGKTSEAVRCFEDYELDFTGLIDVTQSDKVLGVRYYTENPSIQAKLKNDKFKALNIS